MISPITLNGIRTAQYGQMSFKSLTSRAVTEGKKASIPHVYPSAHNYTVSPITTTIEKSRNSYNLFKAKLNSIFIDCARTENLSPAKAIGTLEFNDKKFEHGIEYSRHLKQRSGIQTKRYINDNDIISGKIILDNGTKQEGNKILSKLKKAIKEKRIEITEIGLFGVNTNTDYADNNRVNAILEEMNSRGKACQKITNRKANGFHSIIVKIPLEDGFTGTLEIMGKEVAKLKEVEDILHSFKKGTPVDSKYDKLKEAYKQLSDDELSNLRNYTKLAYTTARSDELFGRTSDKFVSVNEFKLPAIFDFNSIAKM